MRRTSVAERYPKTGQINSNLWAFRFGSSSECWMTLCVWALMVRLMKKLEKLYCLWVFLCAIYQYFNCVLKETMFLERKKTGNLKGTRGNKKGSNFTWLLRCSDKSAYIFLLQKRTLNKALFINASCSSTWWNYGTFWKWDVCRPFNSIKGMLPWNFGGQMKTASYSDFWNKRNFNCTASVGLWVLK